MYPSYNRHQRICLVYKCDISVWDVIYITVMFNISFVTLLAPVNCFYSNVNEQ